MTTHSTIQHKPRIALVSLGCSKNTVDSEKLLGHFYDADFDLVREPIEADAVIVNTCGFIQPAIDETRDTLSSMIRLKKKQKDIKVFAMGCYVSRGTEDWKKSFPDLDGLFPLSQSDKIVSHLQDIFDYKAPKRFESFNHAFRRPVATTLSHYSYLKIAEGCKRTCTYCTIPSIRGDNVSKSIEDLLKEAEYLAKRGVKELILIAQDTTAYGIDLYGKPSLLELLKRLTLVSGIEWFRLFYAYPDHIDSELTSFLLESPKMLPYLDLPIQHSHPEVLRRMCRVNSFSNYDALFKKLRAQNPDYCLRTTLITGFPGESEEEFQHSFQYLKSIRFDRLGVFKYVREKGTPADLLQNHLTEEEKEKRFEKLMLQQQEIHFQKNQSWIGRTIPVIIDRMSYEGSYVGRSYRDAPDIDSVILIQSKKKLHPGSILSVEVTGMKNYDLEAQV
jgi:ribosomal protein S12 methylthiotransferase